ncbi:capsule biosynthesis protein [Geminicoccus harenae]|uniref:capsule biosynthesis protein n=2 Tax=Geminicoccus harenae TaxID=2498453 RepID=UPI00210620C5|nr:capsule biosynthesis protein [Geminicoccus harenae]
MLQRLFRRLKAEAAPIRAAAQGALVDWASLIEKDRALWERATRRSHKGKSVLIATNTGGHALVTLLESVLAVSLALRGAKVHHLLCDAALPGCLQAMWTNLKGPEDLVDRRLAERLCKHCFKTGSMVFEQLPIEHHTLGTLCDDRAKAEARRLAETLPADQIPTYVLDGMAVGDHAKAGALRFFARGTLENEPLGEPVLRRYFEASLITAFAMQALFAKERIDAAAFHHGIYVPQGIVGEACRRQGVHVANWVAAYRKNCFIFSHHDTYHHTLMDEPVSEWENLPFDDAQEQLIVDYLKSRWSGTRDWIWFHEKPDEDVEKLINERKIDRNRPIIGCLTNVFWDAQLHYPANAFPNMGAWLIETVRWFADHPELQLLIRVHPAEIRGTVPARQKAVDEIAKVFPVLPPNVHVIGPEEQVSTYAAMLLCDSAIVYGTKTGVELTSLGIPVIVAGEAWIRNKGLTTDARSVEHYREILGGLPFGRRLDAATVRRARMYAYHFFFRRMLPLPFLVPSKSKAMYDLGITSLEELMPGHHPGLDVICDGILNGSPFIYPAELLGLHDAEPASAAA